MIQEPINNWQAIQDEVLRRIHNRDWKPGKLIPNEADLALEFGCARATVNRALRTLAENGVLDRKRKAGTRVALHPIGKATLNIPIIRQEIEEKGQAYGYALIEQSICHPPLQVHLSMGTKADVELLHVKSLHTGDGVPYVIEDRWINHHAVCDIKMIDFSKFIANEWLLTNAPYTHGDISFLASNATTETARLISAKVGNALFEVQRTTFNHHAVITTVTLTYRPGYRMKTSL